jgi:methionyl-tRNA formyltransferase
MRIVFFHNWSWIGSALGKRLIEDGLDDLWLIGGHAPRSERDPELVQLARRSSVLQVAPKDVRSPQFARRIAAFRPDLIVVGTFVKKLPRALLEIPKVAAINVHSSLLPAYRGALPEFWVIRNGEKQSGVTIHLMTEEFDAGRILAKTALDLARDETLLSISMKLAQAAVPLLADVLARYRRGERPEGEPQDESLVGEAPLVKEHHLRIDWREPARAIERLARAAFPVFDMHTIWRGEKLVVRSVRIVPDGPIGLAPGELSLDRRGERLFVGTGEGALLLTRLELAGDAAGGFRFAERHGLGQIPGERFSSRGSHSWD